MSRELGMTVDEMLSRISSKELTEQMAYEIILAEETEKAQNGGKPKSQPMGGELGATMASRLLPRGERSCR